MTDSTEQTHPRVYLDHAATSWPKAGAVLEAMTDFALNGGATAGRGGYRSAQEAGRIVDGVRMHLSKLIGAGASSSISLHSNGTAALNTAILGLVRPGDHVVTTAVEHNSVLRVLSHLEQTRKLDWTIVECDRNGQVTTEDVMTAIRPNTRLVAVTHASNVTGAVQPIAELSRAMQTHPAALLVDAAQTVGHLPIHVREMGIDMLAAPGHKCIGGPQGTGFLYVAKRWQEAIVPSLFGGTGSVSESLSMPTEMPSKLEAGNLNVPALAGLLVAVKIANDESSHVQSLRRTSELSQRLHQGLNQIRGVKVHGYPGTVPVVSFGLESLSPTDVAAILDAEFGVEVRAGLHCAAKIHDHLGTAPDGTVRVSAGKSTTDEEVDVFLRAVKQIQGE